MKCRASLSFISQQQRMNIWVEYYLDGHGLCGAAESGPESLLHCIDALIPIACHFDVCRGRGNKRRWRVAVGHIK